MKKNFRTLLFICLILSLPLAALARSARDCNEYCQNPEGLDPPRDQICICNPLTSGDLEDIIENLIDFIFTIAFVLAPLMVIYAGLLFMTAGGNASKIEQAKNIIIWTLIGLIIVLLARGLIAIIKQLLGI
jgi:magnesium-transporting ATPase (P-type)